MKGSQGWNTYSVFPWISQCCTGCCLSIKIICEWYFVVFLFLIMVSLNFSMLLHQICRGL
jgi:hypothetical protein